MSRIFKAPQVNVGQPFEVTISETELPHHKRAFNTLRSSDLSGLDPNDTASVIISEANIQANDIVDEANSEANRIIVDAEVEGEQIKKTAQEQGYKEGYTRGVDDGKRETEDLANEALMIKEELEIERANLTRVVETQVVNLIIQSVKKIVGNELATRENIILKVVVKALNMIGSGENIVVKVSQEDFEVLSENKSKVVSECENISEFEAKKDLLLKKCDCIIETECGTVDAGIATQVHKFEDIIIETMGIDINEK